MDTIGGFWAGAVRFAHARGLDEWIGRLGGWDGAARATVRDLVAAGAPSDVAHRWLAQPPLTTAGRALVRTSPEYPNALRTVKGAPPVLFVEGDVACLAAPSIAIVGTRRCSTYGAAAAHRIAYATARRELCVVSGLARGIDTYAHRGALEGRGRTIAVLGHGLGHTSPPSNVTLRRRILEEGGLVLSTWPDDVAPARHTFPERNRWIAALSRRVVVVEAPEQSGALITAHQAMDLGRDEDLWVVPGPLGDRGWRGSAGLLSWGVRPLVDVDAFLSELVGDAQAPGHPDWLSALMCGATLDECARMRNVSAVDLLYEVQLLELEGRVGEAPRREIRRSGRPLVSTVRLSGRGARFVQLLHDFGHIDQEGADRLLVAVAELHTELGGELDEAADVDLVRRAAAMLFSPQGEESISMLLEEDWPLLFS